MELENNPIKVLLADDHPIPMAGFASSLAEHGITVIGKAGTPDEAVKMYDELEPNVLILDIRFGERLTGLDAAKELLLRKPTANIVFLSQFDQDTLVQESYRIGGRAFLTKDCNSNDLVAAVTSASAGDQYFPPNIAKRLASLSVGVDKSPRSLLDTREFEIFVLMAKGCTNVEMADQLSLSAKTISNISQSIKIKLNMHRPADITRLAIKYGFFQP